MLIGGTMKIRKIIAISLLAILIPITSDVYADDTYPDDLYDGDYSIDEITQNYSLVSFGKTELDINMPRDNFSKGDARIFHINSQFLVNGTLNNFRTDLRKGNKQLSSYAKKINSTGWCGNGTVNSCNMSTSLFSDTQIRVFNRWTQVGGYINFDRLYSRVQEEQELIPQGEEPTQYLFGPNNERAAYIKLEETDKDYYAFHINNDELLSSERAGNTAICFDGLDDVKDKTIVVTINATGSIVLPRTVQADSQYHQCLNRQHDGNITTNDYLGMPRPSSDYANYYVEEKYFGNIIYNIPNATSIIMQSGAYDAHIIAPNANIIGNELQIAGSVVTSSISLNGNSELHFYPLSTSIPHISSTNSYKATSIIDEEQGSFYFDEQIDPKMLREGVEVRFRIHALSGYTIDEIIINDLDGNPVEYRQLSDTEYSIIMPASDVVIEPKFKKQSIMDIINNPKTGDALLISALVLILGGIFAIYLYKTRGTRRKI